MLDRYKGNWYTREQIVEKLGWSERKAYRQLAAVTDSHVRSAPSSGRGRPATLYHYSAHPELAAHHVSQSRAQHDERQDKSPSDGLRPSPDDLALAMLRASAVLEYNERRKLMPEAQAAKMTAADYARKPRTQVATIEQRLPGGHTRKRPTTVTLGRFGATSLRRWASLYSKRKDVLDLAPKRKKSTGRKPSEIPPELFDFVYSLSASTARADVSKAVEHARAHWPADNFPDVSVSTWQRRILAHDPRKAGKDLMHSVSRFRTRQSPDIEIDWSLLPYNGRWEIDDVQEDWYALSSDLEHTMRPYAYAIIRTRTRQWVAVVTSETPIVQEQVRTLIGVAMASSQGGIPDQLKFERGTVACEPYLEGLLMSLGVEVSRTSMDGGAALPTLPADRATGHFQGKGVIESNFRKHHGMQWSNPLQVGGNERETAPARTETLRRMAEEAATRGEFIFDIHPKQWHRQILAVLDKHNDSPHSGLQKIVDPADGKSRHMTPNEMATHLKDEQIRLMDERLLPLFHAKGVEVNVTRNGFRLRNFSYGRFDDELKLHRKVTAFVSADHPTVAYVSELGRCVEGYEKQKPGEFDQFERKRHQEKQFRNQLEQTVARAVSTAGEAMIQAVQVTRNPVPERARATVTSEELLNPATGLGRGIRKSREEAAESDRRFDVDASRSRSPRPRKRGVLAKSEAIGEHVAMLSQPHTEDDKWNSL